MATSARLGFNFLEPGQSQKEHTVNETLQSLDMLITAAVEGPPQDAPPPAPAEGQCFIVGAAPTGIWGGKAGQLAGYGPGGWRFQAPFEGLTVLDKSTGLRGEFRSGSWEFGLLRGSSLQVAGVQVIGAQEAAIAAPTGGSTVDSEARSAIGGILNALRSHGLISS